MRKIVIIDGGHSQVKNYDRYEYADGTADRKQAYKDAHWEEDLAKAREAGKRMAEELAMPGYKMSKN